MGIRHWALSMKTWGTGLMRVIQALLTPPLSLRSPIRGQRNNAGHSTRRVRRDAPVSDQVAVKLGQHRLPLVSRVLGLAPNRCVSTHPTGAAGALCLGVVAFLAGAFLLTGCETQPTINAPASNLPSYEELAPQHNANAALLEQMWSRCTIAMRWEDAEGKQHHQQAEGLFIFRGERDIALKISKIDAVNLFWFGSNDNQYWLIDEYNQPTTTYVGSHNKYRSDLPIKLPVSDLLQLIAVRPIAEEGRVESRDGLITLLPKDQPIRLYLDPQTKQPVKSEVLNENGQVEATCFMHNPQRLDVPGVNSLQDPFIATRFVVSTPSESGSMTLAIDDMQTSRVSDVQFDLGRLKKAFPTERTVNLNATE